MHRYIVLFVMVFAMVLQGKIVDSKKALKPISKTYFKTAESSQNSMRNLDLSTSTPIRYPNNSRVEAVLVDSSVNGYGMYVSATKPLSYHPDKGYFMCYRQWMPNDPPVPGGNPHSGYIGGAWSPVD